MGKGRLSQVLWVYEWFTGWLCSRYGAPSGHHTVNANPFPPSSSSSANIPSHPNSGLVILPPEDSTHNSSTPSPPTIQLVGPGPPMWEHNPNQQHGNFYPGEFPRVTGTATTTLFILSISFLLRKGTQTVFSPDYFLTVLVYFLETTWSCQVFWHHKLVKTLGFPVKFVPCGRNWAFRERGAPKTCWIFASAQVRAKCF